MRRDFIVIFEIDFLSVCINIVGAKIYDYIKWDLI